MMPTTEGAPRPQAQPHPRAGRLLRQRAHASHRAALQGRRRARGPRGIALHPHAPRGLRRAVGRELLLRDQRRPRRPQAAALHPARPNSTPRRAAAAWFRERHVFQRARRCAPKIVDAGGQVGLGGHGQLQGLRCALGDCGARSGGPRRRSTSLRAARSSSARPSAAPGPRRSSRASSPTSWCSTPTRSTTSATPTPSAT